jgi:hypothetical protein
LSRFDIAAPFLWAGSLLLGAGIGGWFAHSEHFNEAINLCLVAGGLLLAGGVALRRDRIISIRQLYADLEQRLCLYEHDPRAQAIRQSQRQREQAEEDARTMPAYAARAWHFLTGRRRNAT